MIRSLHQLAQEALQLSAEDRLALATELIDSGHAVCVGGGVGTAVVHPMAQGLAENGAQVTSIIGGRAKEWVIFEDELKRCDLLGVPLLNIHPGSHLKEISEEECLDFIAEGINRGLNASSKVAVVLENTAGQGSNMGFKFEHLAYIMKKVKKK